MLDSTPTLQELVLTTDQLAAEQAFIGFLASPLDSVFVLKGYSGTGKSTLVRHLLQNMHRYMESVHLINPSAYTYMVQLTATTNKAAENLAQISGMDVRTIHSFLELRVDTDYKTGKTQLIPRTGDVKEGYLLVIDEASMIDSPLLQMIFELTTNCKIMFIGDPSQLRPVKATSVPVFESGFPNAELSQVMRQLDASGQPKENPITDLATAFRHRVNGGPWPQFKPDGQYVVYLPRDQFEDAILADMMRPDWRYRDSKVLAWTNKCVIGYNNAIRSHVAGDPHFQPGDYAVVNKFVQVGKESYKTDQMVYISDITEPHEMSGLIGRVFTLDYRHDVFIPDSLEAKKALITRARATDNIKLAMWADNLIDLRAAYAQTINKSQGSTYTRVFIDLDDIKRCNNGNDIARMLYVGVSRAQLQVFLTGDLV